MSTPNPKHLEAENVDSVDSPNSPVPETFIGVIARVEEGQVFVDFDRNPTQAAMLARSTIAVSKADVGSEVALSFVQGQLSQPVVTGLFRSPEGQGDDMQVQVDGEKVTIVGEKRVVLQCGKASITLTEDGKVLIRGTYFFAQSSGIAQVKGAALRLN